MAARRLGLRLDGAMRPLRAILLKRFQNPRRCAITTPLPRMSIPCRQNRRLFRSPT
ncbi:protein of unknown function [Burkholderia multivorans]